MSGGALGGGRMVEDSSSIAGTEIMILPKNFLFVECLYCTFFLY